MNMRHMIILFTLLAVFAISATSWAGLGDVAIFSEGVGWISQENADIQRAIVFDSLKNDVPSVGEVAYQTNTEIGPWAEERIDNGAADIIILFGWLPAAIYTPENSQVDDSIVERFIYGGNIVLNCCDYTFYVSDAINGDTGLKTIININADMWAGGTVITPTDLGAEHTPSLVNFTSERPFKSEQIVDPWNVEAAFGDNSAGFFDPGIIKLNESSGRVGICMQEPGLGDAPRGQILIEMINFISQQADVATPVEPAGKATTTWGHIKDIK